MELEDVHGDRALHVAAKGGHLEVVTLLKTKGADLNSKGSYGNTALIKASYWGKFEVVKVSCFRFGYFVIGCFLFCCFLYEGLDYHLPSSHYVLFIIYQSTISTGLALLGGGYRSSERRRSNRVDSRSSRRQICGGQIFGRTGNL